MTVDGEGGAVVDVVEDGGAEAASRRRRPGRPHRPAMPGIRADETASSCPVPAGAGCPMTSGVPDRCPSTGGTPDPVWGVVMVQAAAASPSVTQTLAQREPAVTGRARVVVMVCRAPREDNSGGQPDSRCIVGYPRRVNWVDLLIIGLMLIAAVHGLRLGALVQIFAFVGFWVGFLLGAVVWVPALKFVHPANERLGITVAAVLLTAGALGIVGRVAGTYSNVTLRRHHLGHIDSALGVGVAVVAVLLSSWLVASVISSPNSRYTWPSSRRPLRHFPLGRSDPAHRAPGVQRSAELSQQQGFPQVFSTLTQPSPSVVAMPTDAATGASPTRRSRRPSKFWVRRRRGAGGSGFVVGHGLVATNAHVVAGEPSTQVVVGGNSYRATVVLFDPKFDLAIL